MLPSSNWHPYAFAIVPAAIAPIKGENASRRIKKITRTWIRPWNTNVRIVVTP
jgi:hypothetical protein